MPTIAAALLRKCPLDNVSFIAGLCAGVFVVIPFTFSPIRGPHINTDISGLIVNIAVIAVVELIVRARRSATVPAGPAEDTAPAAASA
ncbi:hypothetical protein [Nocardia albiluteola]|uniref:hypothetical protein n=1 Tax=Nocardia albiluteola TaxID=2842303 RepID=UPI001C0769B4|nr:hypothetical protein [Nocardia albiluteola]